MTVFYAIILLGIIIFIHELGHFLAAKITGVKVLKFSLGFGPKVIGKKYHDTEYLISSIPFGGYVKMLGEEPGETCQDDDKRFAYTCQPVWKRLVIVASGPLFNLLFALLIFIFVFARGIPILLPEIGSVMPQSPAEQAGLKEGDRIISIEGISIHQWDEMTGIIYKSPGKPIDITIQRDVSTFTLPITPERKQVKDIFGEEKEIGLIGIKPSGNTTIKKVGIFSAVTDSLIKIWEISSLTILAIVKLIQRVLPLDTLGGPILIMQMAGDQASRGVLNFFLFMAIININIGLINLLPIPILDGGHIVFLGIEALRGKPLNEKIIAVAQRVGLALILAIMAFTLYNDIVRLITGTPFPQ